MRERTIDLSGDVGERPEALVDGREQAFMQHLSSVSIACGGHAGDGATMRNVARTARMLGCAIGAHPSYPDRAGFGRRSMSLATPELVATLREQIGALSRIVDEEGLRLSYVKAHGALYHDAAVDPGVARAVADAVRSARAGRLALTALAGSAGERAWLEAGLSVIPEGFADRVYAPDGSLLGRDEGGLITDPGRAAAQAVRLATEGVVEASDGGPLEIRCDTLCLHGDTPRSEAIAGRVRAGLEGAGVVVRSPLFGG